MALYDELLTIATSSGGALLSKIKVAVVVACDVIRLEGTGATNHANRLKWAQETLRDPDSMARRMMWAVLAQNRTFTKSQIETADDPTVQTAVNNAVDLLAQG